jgi:hypothetical protein
MFNNVLTMLQRNGLKVLLFLPFVLSLFLAFAVLTTAEYVAAHGKGATAVKRSAVHSATVTPKAAVDIWPFTRLTIPTALFHYVWSGIDREGKRKNKA